MADAAFSQDDYDRLFSPAKKFFDTADKQQQELNELGKKQAAGYRDTAKQIIAAGNEKIARPALPKFDDLPAPPDIQFKDPTQALGSTMALFAMLASLTTRAPLKSALNIMSSIVKGNVEGQKEQSEYQLKRFHAAMEEARAKQEQQIAQYNAALSNARLSADEKHARVEALIAASRDTVAADVLERGGIEGLRDLNEKRAGAAQAAVGHALVIQARRDAQKDKPLTPEAIHQRAEKFIEDLKSTKTGADYLESIAKKPIEAMTPSEKYIFDQYKEASLDTLGEGVEGKLLRKWGGDFFDKNRRAPNADELQQHYAAMKSGDRPVSPAELKHRDEIAQVADTLDFIDNTIAGIKETQAAVGISGMAGRRIETFGDILGATDEVTRQQIESNISYIREVIPRMLNNRSIFTRQDNEYAIKMIRGLEVGSSVPGTISSLQTMADRLSHKFRPDLERYGYLKSPENAPPEQNGGWSIGPEKK